MPAKYCRVVVLRRSTHRVADIVYPPLPASPASRTRVEEMFIEQDQITRFGHEGVGRQHLGRHANDSERAKVRSRTPGDAIRA